MDAQLIFGCGPEVCADIALACGDVLTGNDLSTAVLISLFTDRRANEDDKLPSGDDPRGWWADAMDGQRIGSRLWLLENASNLPETLALAKEYALEALQWLVSDGIAKSIAVTTAAQRGTDCNNVLAFDVQITKPDSKTLAWRYRYAWDLRQLQSCDVLPNFCA